MRRSRVDKVFDTCNIAFMVLILIIMVYPLYFTIIASISEPKHVAMGELTFYPRGFTWDAYMNVFRNSKIWRGYANSLYYTAVGTFISLVLTLPTAYVLSKKKLHGRTGISWYFLFTMFFSGGLIPTYLVVRDVGLLNRSYSMAVLGCLSVMNIVVTRVFYQSSIPDELYEAAKIDGCSDFGMFFRIALPLSGAIIAVMALFYAVGRWNDFFSALIFLSNSDYFPLQLVLRNILIEGQQALASIQVTNREVKAEEMLALTRNAYIAEAMKYSLIFIASAPLLVAYPFVQKYFVKGVMIGSLKG